MLGPECNPKDACRERVIPSRRSSCGLAAQCDAECARGRKTLTRTRENLPAQSTKKAPPERKGPTRDIHHSTANRSNAADPSPTAPIEAGSSDYSAQCERYRDADQRLMRFEAQNSAHPETRPVGPPTRSDHCARGATWFNLSRLTERWPSGRRRTPGKCVYGNPVSRVRIPPSPPDFMRDPTRVPGLGPGNRQKGACGPLF